MGNNRTCSICRSNKTYINNGKPHWYRNGNDGFTCKKCTVKTIHNPKYNPINNPINNPRKITYKNRRVVMEENPRTGQCSVCKKKVGDTHINYKGEEIKLKRTVIHHEKYHDDDPLKDTMELCEPCHRYIHNKKKKIK